jgi:pyruvate dehydrogenase E1 component alpha subunit
MLLEGPDLFTEAMITRVDPAGVPTDPEWKPPLPEERMLEAYKLMLYARQADTMAVGYQRQGRMYTYPPNFGQEAVGGAVVEVMKDDDWLVPAFRELSAWLARGVTMREIFLYFRGVEEASRFENAKNTLPITVPIASQLPHAVGIGYALKLKRSNGAVFAFVGDGGTSEGDFHEALNFASVWKVPVVFIVQNNQFAISVPVAKQTGSVTMAVKAAAYGMPGVKVNGNDFFAVYEAVREAAERARKGEGPALIEAFTYRRGAHTTSDDPRKYRSEEEEAEWAERDPLKRLKAYLSKGGLWSEENETELLEDYKRDIDRQFSEAEEWGEYPLDDVFEYMYESLPPALERQRIEYARYLNWKEKR